MSQCFNPDCLHINNPTDEFCVKCNQKLLLRERYRALKKIGEGGFGRTFLAIDEDKPSQPFCLIKQFFPSSQGTNKIEKAVELFNKEAIRLDDLGKHPQIPELFAHFEQNHQLYIVQEYITGHNLEQELQKEGVFNESKIKDLLLNILPLLQFIHENQVIHRDIKPENIILRENDDKYVLVDFGSARNTTGMTMLETSTIIGDSRYIAPEQLLGKTHFTSDIYGLGLTCFHLLTNKEISDLFDTEEDKWIWTDFLANNPISDELKLILSKMTMKATNNRFQSAQEVLCQLTSNNHQPPISKTLSLSQSFQPQIDLNLATEFRNELVAFKKEDKWGFMNSKGEEVTPIDFDFAASFSNGLVMVKKEGKWGFINIKRGINLPIYFHFVDSFNDELALVKNVDKYGFINTKGEEIIPINFDYAYPFSNGLALVKKGHKYGFLNTKGEEVIPIDFDYIDLCDNEIVLVKKEDKWGFLSTTGEEVTPIHFDFADSFKHGLALIKKENKYGFINIQGKELISIDFDSAESFSNGLALVRKGDKYGFINTMGTIVIPIHFDSANSFKNGLAKVYKRGFLGIFGNVQKYIDKEGNFVKSY